MSKRFLSVLVVGLTGLLFLAAGVLVAADAPDQISISNKGYKKDKKPPVQFSHKKHQADYKVACTECHHEYDHGKNIWKEGDKVKPCIDCHSPLKKQGKVLKLNLAYHKNCKDCHKALTKAGKKAGPYKKCKECHKK